MTSHWIESGYIKCLDHIFTIPKIRKIIESIIAKEQYTFTFTASLTIQNLYDLKKLISSNINDNSIDLFFSYIFELGYLSPTAKDCYIIPNEEIRQEFIKKLLRYFENKYHIKEELTYATEMFNELINIQNQKLTNKQQEDFLSALNALFQKMYFADINDVDVGNHPNEDIFHSLLNCIIIQSLKIYKFGTEVVSKNILERGRADIVFITNDGIGGIIEVKYSNNGHDVLQQSVSNALEQIEKKNYEFIFQNHINQGVKYGILKVGIGFSINIKQHTNAKHKPEPKVGMDCYYYPIINSDNDEMICDNTSESQLTGCNNEAESII